MKLTMEWLTENSACQDGKEWFAEQAETDAATVCETLIAHRDDWANWLIVGLLDRANRIRYAVYAAEHVIGIYEAKYPADDRPRKAIEAAKRCIEDDSDENRRSAASTAPAAYAAANAASNAANAASNAAAPAAYAAANAAYAAYAAANTASNTAYASVAASYAAAANAADYAARSEMKAQIIRNGIALFREQEKEKEGGK